MIKERGKLIKELFQNFTKEIKNISLDKIKKSNNKKIQKIIVISYSQDKKNI